MSGDPFPRPFALFLKKRSARTSPPAEQPSDSSNKWSVAANAPDVSSGHGSGVQSGLDPLLWGNGHDNSNFTSTWDQPIGQRDPEQAQGTDEWMPDVYPELHLSQGGSNDDYLTTEEQNGQTLFPSLAPPEHLRQRQPETMDLGQEPVSMAAIPDEPANVLDSIHSDNTLDLTAQDNPIQRPGNDKQRIFPCTFCRNSFKNKHDWVRHEKSLHLDLESWTCAPEEGTNLSTSTGQQQCAYCNSPEPTPQHLEEHNHRACAGSSRFFRRKDHLVQHLRVFHRLKAIPAIETWRTGTPHFVCRCGFCNREMDNWKQRVDHLAAHFRKGATMREWKGDHGFSPAILAVVRNAMSPDEIA